MTRRMPGLPWLALAVAWLATFALAGCQRDGQAIMAAANAALRTPVQDHEAGRKIYNFRCYYCHGYSGDANTLASTFLTPRPVDFTASGTASIDRKRMLDAIRDGRPGTAMAGFGGILAQRDIELVADFVREEFMVRKAANTRYHTVENGWPGHERYRDAYPFATGEIPVDRPWEQLRPAQVAGKRLYLATCVSCHDRGRPSEDQVTWELRAVSYPPNQDSCSTCHGADGRLRASAEHMANASAGTTGARVHPQRHANSQSPHAVHDTPPRLSGLTAQQRMGEHLYQKNCAFCHAADGTGRNWIGAFLEPHPRDFTDAQAMAGMSHDKLVTAIREGAPRTSMPAWRFVLDNAEIQAVAAYISRAFHPHLQRARTN